MSDSTAKNDNGEYDLIAIGAGPAGESATELAAAFGFRSLIVEKNRPGGTVTTSGGVPTKTLREAALYFTQFRDRDVYGVHASLPPELAIDAIRKRTWAVCETLQRVTYENIVARGVEYLQGRARLSPGKSITVTLPDGRDRSLTAKVILIATGSRPVPPEMARFDHPGLCDTDNLLSRGRPPKELLVIGAGAVGVEYATIAHALSIPVTIVNRGSRLLTMMDEELSERLATLFGRWGIRIISEASLDGITARGDRLEAALTTGQRLETDTILFAAGRAANTDGLNLRGIGIDTDERGRIVVDASFQTTAEGIYAAGDVLRPTLASIAMEQGRAAVCHAFGIPTEGTVDPTPVSAIYGMPEIAAAGLTEEQCRARSLDYEVGRAELAATPRGAIAGRGGLLKILFLKESRKIVGAHCLGDIAAELVGIGQMAIRCGATVNTIMNMSMSTPTYSYAYKYAAFDGLRRLTARGQKRSPQ